MFVIFPQVVGPNKDCVFPKKAVSPSLVFLPPPVVNNSVFFLCVSVDLPDKQGRKACHQREVLGVRCFIFFLLRLLFHFLCEIYHVSFSAGGRSNKNCVSPKSRKYFVCCFIFCVRYHVSFSVA